MRLRAFSVTLLAAVGVAGLLACGDEEPLTEGDGTPEVREISLFEAPSEAGQPGLMGRGAPSITDVLARLDAVRRDTDARGLLLWIGQLGGAWAQARDVEERLNAVRQAGKVIHCHFTATDNLGYALMASSCDRISMTPGGDLNLVGVSAHVVYARELLDNIGVKAEVFQFGRYKGTGDTFTRQDMPEETRENLGALLTDFHDHLTQAISAGRNLTSSRVAGIIDEGPYDARRAQAAKLIDDIAFGDEAREHARRAAGVERVRRVDIRPKEEPMGLAEILDALGGHTPAGGVEGPHIGLVFLNGTITDNEDDGGEGAHAGPFIRALRSFADDEDVRALVIRIDSPGGSALASDRMWHAVRMAATKKPVIASVGNMAASGGYYIACAATEIFAPNESIIGSIGVVGGKVVTRELAERVGLHIEVLDRGQNASWLSPSREFTEPEREIVEGMMRTTYDRFVRRIEAGRNMERQAVLSVAEGRILSGRRAREAGLVDREGTLWEALAQARQAGGLAADAPVERWPRRKNLLDRVAESLGGAEPGERARGLVRELARTAGPMGPNTALMPMILGQEHVLVALPYSLDVQ